MPKLDSLVPPKGSWYSTPAVGRLKVMSPASIVSRDLTRVHQFINRIEAGLITVNLPTAGVEY